ncbi:MAG: hypothetical protein IJI52_00760 [Solobacterium sp.]|nr:hypothetical protein [Solobacterium sp.]
MIAFIRGTVAAYGADWVIVENSGMGWRISYPHTDTVRLNQNISVYMKKAPLQYMNELFYR